MNPRRRYKLYLGGDVIVVVIELEAVVAMPRAGSRLNNIII